MARLHLALFGPLQVAVGDQPITHFGYDKVPALLAYLAVEADRPHTRDELAALLWPDSDDDAARRSLRVALTRLRQAIGDQGAQPPLLLVDRNAIQFNSAADHTLDTKQFDQLLASVEHHEHPSGTLCAPCAARLAEAVALCRGEFLAQVRVRDSVAFEEWAMLVGERLHQRVVEASGRLMAYHEQHGDGQAAEQYARRLLALEPWSEAAHRCLMRVLAARGQHNAALSQYERCRRILASEFKAAPAPETTELYQHIREDSSARLPTGKHETQHLQQEPAPLDRNRQRMIAKVRSFWIDGVLRASLQQAASIELGLAYQPEAVARPWDLIVRQPDSTVRTVPPETSISDLFDEMQGQLLILGAPGAGKTTLVLELGRTLLDRAERDAALPMPVVFNLSSWAAQRAPLAGWLIDELHERYQVPRALGQNWIASEQILPLLDGLDEVAPEHRAACVAAINVFRAAHWLLDIVVCSRSIDYALLADKLQLQGAVEIQPLTPAQIDSYLARGGKHLATVRTYLREDATLRELSDTPLMLNIMGLAYRNTREAHLHADLTLEQRRAHLFQTYVRRMLRWPDASAHYTPQQTLRWLCWLARGLVEHSQTMLWIERIQPSWLPAGRQRWQYRLGVALVVGLLFGVVFGLFGGIKAWLLYGQATGRSFMTLASMVSVLVAGLVVGQAVAPDPRRSWFGGTIGRSARNAALFGVAVGGMIGALWGLIAGDIGGELTIALYSGLIIGLLVGVLVSKIPIHGQIVPIEQFRWSGALALQAAPKHLARGSLFGLTTGSALCLALARRSGWAAGLANGVGFGLTVALATAVVLTINTGLTTSEVEVRLEPNQGIWRSAQNMAFIGLVTGLLIGLVGMLANLLAFSLFVPGYPTGLALVLGLLYGPTLGLAAGLFYGGLACIQHALLRLHLWHCGAMPLNYARFLDYAARRVLLRKAGGGYMFIHRLLLDHFAALDPESPFLLPPDLPGESQPIIGNLGTQQRGTQAHPLPDVVPPV
jgi:DNA-binding SARP family transcriptional activator